MHEFLVSLAVSFGINLAFFALAAIRKTDVVTDLSYGLSFAASVVALVLLDGVGDPWRLGLAAMVLLWALRLAAYLFRRILAMKVDHRFDGMRERPLVFARFWTLQALSVAIILLPVTFALGRPTPGPSALQAAGAVVWLAGLLIEALADAQKSAWKRKGETSFLDRGLWAWSRHPNYFGEILVWWGIWLYALPSLSGLDHLAALGPIFITLLLLFVSGIPLLEKAATIRYAGRADYAAYRAATSILVPLPPRKSPKARP